MLTIAELVKLQDRKIIGLFTTDIDVGARVVDSLVLRRAHTNKCANLGTDPGT